MRRFVHTTALLVVAALLVVSFSGVQLTSGYFESDSFVTGPYVDEVIFRVIANQDERILTLLDGAIEMDNSFFDPVYLPTIDEDPNISIHQAVRNGYGHITINCEKYPLNISGLRRAFAFAFNKSRVTELIMDGFSIEHDSLVPLPNGWCVEDQFDWHYYTARPDIGNQILDNLGFKINETSGFRLTPNGTAFEINVEHFSCGCGGIRTADIAVEALYSLHIDASETFSDFGDFFNRLNTHGNYDMGFYAVNFYDNDVDWLGYEYWSEYADVEFQNPANFRNNTYDSWRDQLLYGTTYEEVHEAAAEMQKILHYNVPRLVVYENMYMQAYRNDAFTGHVEDLGKYISGPWTLRNIYKLDGTPGGSVPIAISQEPETFNIFTTNSVYSRAILDNLWPSLYKYGPDLNPWPDLADSMLTETHSDNAAVPDGHTRFTIDIVQNATWSDGEPLTAEDVAFSMTYAFESAMYGNPAGADVGDLYSATAPTSFRAVIEFTTESYWHFGNFAFDYVIPEHIFNDDTGIGYEGWETWNPVLNPAEPHVTCGPFTITDYEASEFYKIEKNPLFHYAADLHIPITEPTSTTPTSSSSTTTTSEHTNQSLIQEINWSLVFNSIIIAGSGIVIIFCMVVIFRRSE